MVRAPLTNKTKEKTVAAKVKETLDYIQSKNPRAAVKAATEGLGRLEPVVESTEIIDESPSDAFDEAFETVFENASAGDNGGEVTEVIAPRRETEREKELQAQLKEITEEEKKLRLEVEMVRARSRKSIEVLEEKLGEIVGDLQDKVSSRIMRVFKHELLNSVAIIEKT